MNNLQNLSKRIRKRIQNSVKRLFTNKSSSYEYPNSPTNSVVKDDIAGDKRQHSSDSDKMNDSPNRTHSGPYPISKIDHSIKYMGNQSKNSIPIKSGESLNVVDICKTVSLQYTSSGLKSGELSKTTSKEKSDKSKSSFVCPAGRHFHFKNDEPCICINIEQLSLHQTSEIIYEWHKFKSEPTSLDSFKLEYPNTCIQGGQGVVFWVYDFKNNRHFALKMKLRENKSNSSWLIEQRESKMLKEIQHNFIVNLYHVHETPGAMFMTMEYLDGGCLWSHIAKKGTLPESYTIYYSACILNALHHLHKNNIVYRDLKAENIVLDGYGRPKLIDFGMAKKITNQNNYLIHKIRDEGTENYPATQYYYAAYLAPEIYTKPSSANIFIDSWGLGYVVSEILLGYGVYVSMPWEKLEKSNLNWKFQFNERIGISNNCKNFLEKMLKYNPNSRMSLDEAINHPFFQHVNWSTLVYVKPPDLSVFRRRVKGSGIIQAVLNDKYRLSSLFEICDLQLPDPLLTPNSNNQCSTYINEVASPTDTPINPNAPSIRLPILVNKDKCNYLKYNQISNNLKYDIYRALNIHGPQCDKISIDTISNLRPLKRF